MVGRLGAAGERLEPADASVFNLPAVASGSAVLLVNDIWSSPAISAFSAGAPPLYGTRTRFKPDIVLNNSPDKWLALPMPEDASESGFGADFACARSSLSVETGSALLTERYYCASTMRATAEKSLIAS